MPQLIQMRQRIKAIETIKKVTHAMRLIAMSTHARLRDKIPLVNDYNKEVKELFYALLKNNPSWSHPLLQPEDTQQKCLIILIGSQKGLCGTFNESLFTFFHKKLKALGSIEKDFIAVGKKISDHLKRENIPYVLSFDEFNTHATSMIAKTIETFIITNCHSYNKVIVISNYPKTFFAQKQQETNILPISEKQSTYSLEDYYWYEQPSAILDKLIHLYIAASFELIMLDSLLAEHAARFISMDSSTRNAKDILQDLRRDYNKLRQAKITRELTELTASFIQ